MSFALTRLEIIGHLQRPHIMFWFSGNDISNHRLRKKAGPTVVRIPKGGFMTKTY